MDEQDEQQKWNLIFSYTREQAIQDGVLVDITKTVEAKEAGFRIPVVITAGVNALLQVPEDLVGLQEYRARLSDTLLMAASAFLAFKGDRSLVPFDVIYQMTPNRAKKVNLWLSFNQFEGFTILLPEEY